MFRRLGKSVCALGSLAVLMGVGSGCASDSRASIAQLEPYVGGEPPPIRRLAPPTRRSAPSIVSGERGWVPSGGISDRWDSIVIHHSASNRSSPQGMRDWHVNGRGWSALGYHFVIGNGVAYGDGRVHVGERWTKQMHGAHCKTPGNHYNDHGVGICLIGDFESSRPTRKQIASLAKLVSFLSRKCGIPRSRILTHGGITRKTACPGRNFSLPRLLRQMSVEGLAASSR